LEGLSYSEVSEAESFSGSFIFAMSEVKSLL
jgi:hypothetical protein